MIVAPIIKKIFITKNGDFSINVAELKIQNWCTKYILYEYLSATFKKQIIILCNLILFKIS